MSDHTPGPWRLDNLNDCHCVDDTYHCIAGGDTLRFTGLMSVDDSRLIAAAPTLLEALELGYLALLKQPFPSIWRIHNQHVFAAMRDAIAVATGQDAEAVQNRFESRAQEAK